MFRYYQKFILASSLISLVLTSHSSIALISHHALELEENVVINADKLDYDLNKDITIATGNVELMHEGNILIADKVIYYKHEDSAHAMGNVSVLDSKGNIAFSDKLILTEKTKKGLVKALEVKLNIKNNDAILNAKSGERISENKTILYDTRYTSCKCDNLGPVWQIKAKKTVILNQGEKIEHYNAWLEAFEVPILYIPYISHTGPKAQRKSGFLMPRYYPYSSTMGWSAEIPYYFNIAPQADLVTTFYYYNFENPLLYNRFRYLTSFGTINFDQSITKPEAEPNYPKRKIKGHVALTTNLLLENNWNFIGKYIRAHDKTFLKKYDFDNNSAYLTSQLSLQKFNAQDKYLIDNFKYQDLAEIRHDFPIVAPLVNLEKNWEINDHNYVVNKFNTLNLIRKNGTDVTRISNDLVFNTPYNFDNGVLTKFTNSLRLDFYKLHRTPDPYRTCHFVDANIGRVLPETAIDIKYPLANKHLQLTPLLSVVYSPYGNNDLRLPNEDSTGIEISDVNLFNHNHYPGLDRVEGGFRSIYGLNNDLKIGNLQTGLFFGQSYRKRDVRLTPVTGMSHKSSDYVGRYYLKLNEHVDIFYRFRLDQHNFAWHRNEVDLVYNKHPLSLTLRFDALDQKDNFSVRKKQNKQGINEPFPLRKQKSIGTDISYWIAKHWNISASGNKNITRNAFTDNRGFVNASAGIHYNGDCIISNFSISRNFSRDRDKKPETKIMVNFMLKTLND